MIWLFFFYLMLNLCKKIWSHLFTVCSPVHFWWVCAYCSFRSLLLADRSWTWCGLLLFQLLQSWKCCAFWDTLLLTTVVKSGYLSYSGSPSVSFNKPGHSPLTFHVRCECLMWILTKALNLYLHEGIHWAVVTRLADWIIDLSIK